MSKPRILILGKRGGILQWYEGLLAAQTSLPEFSIHGFAFNHNHWQERFFKKLLKLIGANTEHYTARLLTKKIQQIQPDIILIADLFYLDTSILKALQTAKPKATIYHWIGDFFDQRLTASQSTIDQFLFTDSTFIKDAHLLGIEHSSFLPLATNPKVFKQIIPFDRKKERLLFIGAYSESREDFIRKIDFPMSIVGKGWDKLNSNNPDLDIYARNISIHEVAKLYDEHKYILNVINKSNTRQGLAMRCFDVQACGSLLITEYTPDLEKANLNHYYFFHKSSGINSLLHQINENNINYIENSKKILINDYSTRLKQVIEKTITKN